VVEPHESCVALDAEEAIRLLVEASGLEAGDDAVRQIAEAVGAERPALRWAGALARTTGWRPLVRRLTTWAQLPGLLREAPLPWADDVQRVQNTLSSSDAELLTLLSACDAPFTWDVLESVAPAASIESICRLEEVGLLVRNTRAGVVAFIVPYCVRAVHRLREPARAAERERRFLDAWVMRAEELRPAGYGTRAQTTLTELGFAVPLAERALASESRATRDRGLVLWGLVSDAMFFASAIDFDSAAFASAVTIADEGEELAARARARVVAARARLERGDPAQADSLLEEALRLATAGRGEDLRSEALRGTGWAALASAQLERARTSFDAALALCPPAVEPRGHADATAGLGILALLTGDPERARARLRDALATHVLLRDGPREAAVRGMMALLPEHLGTEADVAQLSRELDELRATAPGWRQALLLARLGLAARARGDGESERAHLVEARAAAGLSRMAASSLVASMVVPSTAGPASIVVGEEGRSLRLPSGEAHDLTRHGPVRRLLWALALAHREKPGIAMSTLELVDAGWPGEKMKHEAATLRVYTTVRRLRALGLAGALLTRDDGYLLDPVAPIALDRS
jgi:tetratricopeptide (TPR) repeat protein